MTEPLTPEVVAPAAVALSQVTDKAALELVAPTLLDRAKALTITTDDDLVKVDGFVGDLRAMERAAHAEYDPVCDRAYAAHRAATALRARVIDPITQAIKLAKETMGTYQNRRRREIEAAQAAIEAEARRKADEEKLAQAVVLEQSGNKEAAEIVMAAPAVVQIPKAAMAAVAMPKLANTATRENWMFKLVDPTLASIPLQFLILDESKVGKLVKSLKGDAQAILGAGILVYSEEGVAGKGGAK